MKKIIGLSILLLIGVSFSGKSQYTVTIGTGTGSSAYPFNVYNGYTRIAAIYDSTEIDTTGVITTLAWNVADYNSNWAPVKIYLKTTTDATLVADTWSNMISGSTLVYSNTINFPNYGWKVVNITPFAYSSGNLLVLVETNFGGTGTTTANFYSTNSGYNETWYNNTTPPAGNGEVNIYGRPNIQITFGSTVGIIENISGTTINIYPNPSGGKFFIEMEKIRNGVIEIYNVLGEKIYSSELINQKQEIDLSKEPNGIYFLQLKTENGIAIQRIILQK